MDLTKYALTVDQAEIVYEMSEKLREAGMRIEPPLLAMALYEVRYPEYRPQPAAPQPKGLSWTWAAVIVAGMLTFLCCAMLFVGMALTEMESRGVDWEPMPPVPTTVMVTPEVMPDFEPAPPFGLEDYNE